MRVLDKPFYPIAEICTRWSISEQDVAAFVLAGELTLSATVAGLRVIHGVFEEIDVGQWEKIPTGRRFIIGTVDIERDDAWTIMREFRHEITRLKAPENEYITIGDYLSEYSLTVRCEDLVVCKAEVHRFEAAYPQLAPAVTARLDAAAAVQPIAHGDAAIRPRPGAPTRYDWDEFWIEACRRIFEEGVPATQGEFVRLMLDWFTQTSRQVPDASTVKKKLSRLWRQIAPRDVESLVDQRKRA